MSGQDIDTITFTYEQMESITGFFGEMLDDPDLPEPLREVIEMVYTKVAKKLGVW